MLISRILHRHGTASRPVNIDCEARNALMRATPLRFLVAVTPVTHALSILPEPAQLLLLVLAHVV